MPNNHSFPQGFLWGSATAAHQVEGNNFNSDCWALERATPSIFKDASGEAVDQWHHFADDMAVLSSLGLNAYRFSIEWARIEPEEGAFSQAALDHYQRCIDACRQRGISPIVTFHHFTAPLWVARDGGLANDAFPDRFARFCGKAASALRGISHACTLNELNIPLLIQPMTAMLGSPQAKPLRDAAEAALGGPITGFFLTTPPEKLVQNGIRAHRLARDAIKDARSDLPVGVTLSIQDEQASPGAEGVRDQRVTDFVMPFLEAVKGDDFVGVQTYTRNVARPDGTVGPEDGQPITMMGYEDRPRALADVCRMVWRATQTPILVTESGLAGDNDARRVTFITETLEHLQEAIVDGVDVRGYLYWSLLDNFEWVSGYGPKFGLIAVDRATQRRTLKPSGVALGRIAQANGLVEPAVIGTTDYYAIASADNAHSRLAGTPLGTN